jgi:hypothetical protein
MTITVSQMIEALSKLPQDAELVVTESGYYCYGEFATIMLPEPYTPDTEEIVPTVMYRIGHSHQSY